MMVHARIKHTGFTLMELMVSVFVLLVVMVAVGRIFSTTSAVSASGRAISETLQQGVAIEQQLREDISKIAREGFLAIRSVSLANNINGDYLLIDPSLPIGEIIRCDQLIFFTNGIATPMLNTGSTDFAGQGLASMVYYGHGVRFPQLDGIGEGINATDESDNPKYFDSDIPEIITPWYEGIIEVETRKYTEGQDERFNVVADGIFANGRQSDPHDWVLCKQVVVLGDDDMASPDDTRKTVYLGRGVSTQTIFPWDPRIGGSQTYPHVLHGRVDIAATQLDDIRQSVLQSVEFGTNSSRWWRVPDEDVVDQQELIASLFYWPRVEPYPSTAIRYDQAMMMPVLAEGCVSFQVEWTYDEGVGQATDSNQNTYTGYRFGDTLWLTSQGTINRGIRQGPPWWGGSWRNNQDDPHDLAIGYDTLTSWTNDANQGISNLVPARSVDPTLIEPVFVSGEGHFAAPVPTVQNVIGGVSEYWAIFGYNGNEPFFENDLDFLNDDTSGDTGMDAGLLAGDPTWRYTPWPNALRITIRLLDRDNKLGSGWTYQFVVNLPERRQ